MENVRDTDVMKTKLLEARIEGEKQGRAEGIMSTARNLRRMGLPVSDIAKATGFVPRRLKDSNQKADAKCV